MSSIKKLLSLLVLALILLLGVYLLTTHKKSSLDERVIYSQDYEMCYRQPELSVCQDILDKN